MTDQATKIRTTMRAPNATLESGFDADSTGFHSRLAEPVKLRGAWTTTPSDAGRP